MSGLVVDTSVWIDFFSGRDCPALEDALAQGAVVLPPLVVAEIVSGTQRPRDREAIKALAQDLALHPTPHEHWVRVGELRGLLRAKGVSVSTPDAHVAQCALDLDVPLLTRDRVFTRIAEHSRLKLARD